VAAPPAPRLSSARITVLAIVLSIVARTASAETLEAQGRRLYRDGMLASGGSLTAVVAGDVPVEGAQLPCVRCHARSGMGSTEGSAAVPPVSGAVLFAPAAGQHPRPPYTDDTLVRAIREGVDPAGRPLDRLMPRYRLSDADASALVAYLRTLSVETSPGVTAETIRFATVVTDGVDPDTRDAMLQVLEMFFDEKNGATRLEPRRALTPGFQTGIRAYRKWILDRWALHGPSSTWAAQLEDYYRSEPPFALLAGLASGSWQPIHEFCERKELPCLLPNTDLPVVAPGDFHTLYFSKGVALEAEVLAERVRRTARGAPVLQVFRRDGVGGDAAEALHRALTARPGVTIDDVPLPPGGHVDEAEVARRAAETKAGALVLWLPAEELAGLEAWTQRTVPIYLSSTMLGERLTSVPGSLRRATFVVHPFTLPSERTAGLQRLRAWLEKRGGTLRAERIQAQTYFACLAAGDALMHVRTALYRDYFLDTIDHTTGIAALAPYYPRLGFGPGQRYLAKGAYVLTLGGDGPEAIVTDASWVTVGG
jgi:hypothetical protein